MSATATIPAGRKLKILTLKQKVELIEAFERRPNGKRHKAIAAEFGVRPNTLSGIIKNKERYKKLFREGQLDMNKQRTRNSVHNDIDVALFDWYRSARLASVPVSRPLLANKAEEMARQLGKIEWQCNDGWLSRFKKRHNIIYITDKQSCNSVDHIVDEDATDAMLTGLCAKEEPMDEELEQAVLQESLGEELSVAEESTKLQGYCCEDGHTSEKSTNCLCAEEGHAVNGESWNTWASKPIPERLENSSQTDWVFADGMGSGEDETSVDSNESKSKKRTHSPPKKGDSKPDDKPRTNRHAHVVNKPRQKCYKHAGGARFVDILTDEKKHKHTGSSSRQAASSVNHETLASLTADIALSSKIRAVTTTRAAVHGKPGDDQSSNTATADSQSVLHSHTINHHQIKGPSITSVVKKGCSVREEFDSSGSYNIPVTPTNQGEGQQDIPRKSKSTYVVYNSSKVLYVVRVPVSLTADIACDETSNNSEVVRIPKSLLTSDDPILIADVCTSSTSINSEQVTLHSPNKQTRTCAGISETASSNDINSDCLENTGDLIQKYTKALAAISSLSKSLENERKKVSNLTSKVHQLSSVVEYMTAQSAVSDSNTKSPPHNASNRDIDSRRAHVNSDCKQEVEDIDYILDPEWGDAISRTLRRHASNASLVSEQQEVIPCETTTVFRPDFIDMKALSDTGQGAVDKINSNTVKDVCDNDPELDLKPDDVRISPVNSLDS